MASQKQLNAAGDRLRNITQQYDRTMENKEKQDQKIEITRDKLQELEQKAESFGVDLSSLNVPKAQSDANSSNLLLVEPRKEQLKRQKKTLEQSFLIMKKKLVGDL